VEFCSFVAVIVLPFNLFYCWPDAIAITVPFELLVFIRCTEHHIPTCLTFLLLMTGDSGNLLFSGDGTVTCATYCWFCSCTLLPVLYSTVMLLLLSSDWRKCSDYCDDHYSLILTDDCYSLCILIYWLLYCCDIWCLFLLVPNTWRNSLAVSWNASLLWPQWLKQMKLTLKLTRGWSSCLNVYCVISSGCRPLSQMLMA